MKFPGAQYADIDDHGHAHVAPSGFPTDGLCRQMRCSRSGQKFAGIGQGDRVFEWVDGAWHDRGPCWGPRAVIYRGEELLIIRPPGPANGYRYIAPDGTPVLAVPDTYAHPTLKVWEYTVLPNGWIVGQGGEGPWGEDPLVILPPDGTRRLVASGMCRFINAYLVDDRVLLAWQQDGIGADARVLTLADVLTLPDAPYVTEPPKPEPPKPEPEPEPDPMPDISSAVAIISRLAREVDAEHPGLRARDLNAYTGMVAARAHREDRRIGRKARNSSAAVSLSTLGVRHSLGDGTSGTVPFTAVDFVRDEVGAQPHERTPPPAGPNPIRSEPIIHPDLTDQYWIRPEGSFPIPDPEPDPDPNPQPEPDPNTPQLQRIEAKLDRLLTVFRV